MAYEFQPYPSWRYHRDGRERLIHTDAEHEALYAEGWRDTPAAFTHEPAPEPEPETPKKKRK